MKITKAIFKLLTTLATLKSWEMELHNVIKLSINREILQIYNLVQCGILITQAAINRNETIVVPDVEQFPVHIACDSRSKSEIVIPLRNNNGEIVGVLDVDSKDLNSFDEEDAEWLEKIVDLVYKID